MLVQVVGGAHRLDGFLLYFFRILGRIEHIILFFHAFLATRNFLRLIPSSYLILYY
jgi:hypothetical protein